MREEGEGESFFEKIVERRFKAYEEKCLETIELVDEALGRPHITIDIALPEGCEEFRDEFEKLTEDEEFVEEVRKLVKKYLQKRSRESKEAETLN